ncbi:C6 finger domain protein [Colletotrichum tofieldiae]|uniref:C6 finger domain protein n=1 Tax=Colletotrichum tofieldiae TaxID=708197 RepID=A0A166U8M7_9PEZI|nr:C6 finger domain protein [Colletotrichum tofieldiae]
MSSSESEKKHRRSHRKSRLGCQQCKKRKIKCDEARPSCLNCVRRDADCSFALESVDAGTGSGTCCCHSIKCQSNTTGTAHTSSGTDCQRSQIRPYGMPVELRGLLEQQSKKLDVMYERLTLMEGMMAQLTPLRPLQPSLNYTDAGLLVHFFTRTVHTIAGDEDREFWLERLPNISACHTHVLHLMLAFAALHKCRTHPEQCSRLFELAEHHQTIGTEGVTGYLKNINDENYEMVYASAILVGLTNLASGPQPGEYIAFSDHENPSLISLIRGVRSIKNCREPASAPERPPARCWSINGLDVSALGFEVDCHYGKHLQCLRHLIKTIPDAECREGYVAAMDDLEQFFVRMNGPNPARPDGSPEPDAAHLRSPLGWLYRVPNSFLDKIKDREPLSLAILACFVVVLKVLEEGWPADGWPEHMMSGVWKHVQPKHRLLIQWPMNTLAWQPAEGLVSTMCYSQMPCQGERDVSQPAS